MALYSAAFTTPAAATAATFATLHTVATDRAKLKEVGFFLNAATASSIQLIRPNNTPVASTTVAGVAHDPADPAGTALVGTAWSTIPTIGTNVPIRRVVLPATAGNGVIWVFPDPVILNVSSWLVFWNFGGATASALSGYVVWDE